MSYISYMSIRYNYIIFSNLLVMAKIKELSKFCSYISANIFYFHFKYML